MPKQASLTKTAENKVKNSIAAKPKESTYQTMDSPVEQILTLQQTIGNQAIQRLLKSGCLQAKLTIGKPNDKYEQEADRIADQVMRMPEQEGSLVNGHSSLVQRQSTCPECPEKEEIQTKPLADQITPLVQRQVEPEIEEEEEEETIQPKSTGTQPQTVTTTIESRIQSLKGGGQPLSESTRDFFEPRFGTDFSQVRVHTDSKAANASKSVNAKAFTTGQDVVFGAGQYSPETSIGRGLLAHELIHVLQQEKSVNRILRRKEDQPNNKTDEKEQDDSSTLPEADTTGTKPEAEVDWLTELKNEVASRTKMPPDAAWKCLEDVAKTTERIPETAWNWLKNLADRHDMEPFSVWDLIEDVVHQTKMHAVAAWNLIEDVAIQNFMPPVEAWNWLEYVVFRTGMAPDAAWNWIEDVAFQYSMRPVEAWDWIEEVAHKIGKEPKDLLILIDEEYIPNPLTDEPHKFNKDDLEARRRDWNLALLIMEKTNEGKLIDWIVGQKGSEEKVINTAIAETRTQMEGLLADLQTWVSEKKLDIILPTEEVKENEKKVGKVKILGGRKKYGYRSAYYQYEIWLKKYYFIKKNFDRITKNAKDTCIANKNVKDVYDKSNKKNKITLEDIFEVGKKWNPSNDEEIREIHWECWRILKPRQRQQEILEASAAPGISRHHWGTDVDIISWEPEEWEKGGIYYDVYDWLKKNAWKYGFMQPYVKESEGDKDRYMEERWHWSYYPVSSVLLQIAKDKKKTLDEKLNDMWKKEEYEEKVESLKPIKPKWKEKIEKIEAQENKGSPFEYLQQEVELPEYDKKWMSYVSKIREEPWWEEEKKTGKK